MFGANVILCPRGEPHSELRWEKRSLQDAIDSLPPEGVLVRVKASGVCHSDLHLWQGYYKVYDSSKAS